MTTEALDQPLAVEGRVGAPRVRRRAAIVAVAVVLGLMAIFGVLAWRASNALMYGAAAHYGWSLANYPALARVDQPLTVHSSTGVTLAGRFFPGRTPATIVLSHGYYGDQDEMLPVANMLHAAGFTVVTYDERGRGRSSGAGTWGALETRDLRSVIDTVVRHPGVDPHAVAEFGFSIGADITILEAASDPRIKAVVADGSWPTLRGYMNASLSDAILHPTWMFSPLAVKVMELRTGANVDQVAPVKVIARISPRPLLLIQGLADTDVTPHNAVVNYGAARSPKTLWMVKGQGHEDTVSPGGASTSPRVGAFFRRALHI
jgi:dipeptidyl aminopeptidase/acylaminoacyl peptidase